MREIEFQETGMKNFGPYIEPMVLKFPNNQLNLLTGPNGIGKTMSLDSIPFTLFGITSKKSKGDEVVNNRIGKNCKTWVKFKSNNDQYVVTRYQKYSKYGNTVVLNKNGKDIKKGHREVLPDIERLICSQKAFMNTLMFGQKVKDFFTDLVDSDKKEIFRKLLGLEQYVILYNSTNKLLKTLNDSKNKLLNKIEIDKGLLADAITQIKILSDQRVRFEEQKKQSLDELSISLEDNKRLLKSWVNTVEKLTSEKVSNTEEIITELTKVRSEINSIEKETEAEIQKIENQKIAKESELKDISNKKKTEISSEISSKIKILRESYSELSEESFSKKTENRNLRHEIDIEKEKLKSKQENHKSDIEEINNVLNNNSSCPTCEQDITEEEVKEKLITKIKNHQSQIEIIDEQITALELEKKALEFENSKYLEKALDELEKITKQIDDLENEEEAKKKEVDDKLTELNSQVYELVENQKEIIRNEKSNTKKDLEQKESKLQNQKEELERIENEIKEVEDTISSLKQEIQKIEDQIKHKETDQYDETQLNSYIVKRKTLEDSVDDSTKELSKIEKEMLIHEFWKTGYSSTGIPSMLIDDSIPFMNEKISEYLELLTNGRYLVSFDTLAETKAGDFRDKISVHVLDTHTKANTRSQLSGGQTRIIDIATILTLGELQSKIQDVKINILLFDEIFDSLDYENATYVSKVLNKLKIDKSIYVISHQHQDQLEADEILEFK